MNKDLKNYLTSTREAVVLITPADAKELLQYHLQRVRDFQHERMVHLLVTLFFGALCVGSVVAVLVAGQSAPSSAVAITLNVAVVILLATELCYVWYYYQLENGVQKLYALTDQIRRKSEK